MKTNRLLEKMVEDAKKDGRLLVDQGVGQVAERPDGLVFPIQSTACTFLTPLVREARNESQFQECVTSLAELCGWKWIHFRPARVVRGGREKYETPFSGHGKGEFDIQLLRDCLVKVELKFGKNKPTPEQTTRLADYKRAGVEAYIWWPDDWEEIVTRLGRPQ